MTLLFLLQIVLVLALGWWAGSVLSKPVIRKVELVLIIVLFTSIVWVNW